MSGSNRPRLSEELREDSPAHALVNWQTKLRQAVLDAVTENDVVEIVKNQVKLAKEGDKAAIRFVMDYVVGARQNVTLVQQNIYGNDGVAIAAQAEKQGRNPKRTDR